ncbi:hypothetical protein PM082_017032 [Marasmius tenuissimus]|nr:hypothetical protein PM082_017032 [Marasmius tenuissimus]
MTTADSDTSDSKTRALTDLPLFLGYILSAFLQGLLVLQVFVYFFAFKKDKTYMRIFVWLVFSLEWVFTIVTTILAARTLVSTGKLFELISDSLSKLLPFVCGLVTLVVQVFYSYRIYLLSGRYSLPIVISLLSVVQCVLLNAAGFNQAFEGLSGFFMDHSHEGMKTPRAPIIVPTWLGLAAVGDSLIAVTLLILLASVAKSIAIVVHKIEDQTGEDNDNMYSGWGYHCPGGSLGAGLLLYFQKKFYSHRCVLHAVKAVLEWHDGDIECPSIYVIKHIQRK